MIDLLAKAGGLFALFAFVHFAVDWIFQSHAEAMVKHNNAKIRAKHCLIYTLGFIPILMLLRNTLTSLEWVVCLGVLFISHFVEDTYHPVFLWAKYVRRPPGMGPSVDKVNNLINFKIFIDSTLGKILMIAVDQIIHLAFLWVLVWMVLF